MSDDRLKKIVDEPPEDEKAKLEFESLYHFHRRKNRRENAINWCFVVFIWICSIGMCLIVIVKILYTVFPPLIYWMNKDQIAQVNDFFVDGGIGGLVVGIFKSKILNKTEET